MSSNFSGQLTSPGDKASVGSRYKSLVTVTLSGTWTGEVDFLYYDGDSLVPLPLTPSGGGAAASAVTGNGTWQQVLPGPMQVAVLLKTLASGGPVVVSITCAPQEAGSSASGGGGGAITAADNAIVTLGSITDPASNAYTATASLMGVLKKLQQILEDEWNQANHFQNVNLATGLVRTADNVGVAQDVASVLSGTTELTPTLLPVNTNTNGQTTLVNAVTNKKIKVMRYVLRAAGAVNIKFQSNSTDLTGPMQAGAAGGGVQAYCPIGEVETAAGEALKLNLDAAVVVGGYLKYVLV